MRPAFFQQQWREIKSQECPQKLDSLARRIASSFVDRYFYSDEYNSEYVHLLCEMATSFADAQLNQFATTAMFEIIIERLCDDFEELQTETYNKFICQVASFIRCLPACSAFDAQLDKFGLASEAQLYQRIESIRLSPDEKLPATLRPRKVLVLSRVTIGADVAITSIICQRIHRTYPDAEIVVIGNHKLLDVYDSKSAIRIAALPYSRRGGLIERFEAWLGLVEQINNEIGSLGADDYILLDPDSRLTQLGVLPVVDDKNYRFFSSRGKQNYPVKTTISELCNIWLDNILGSGEFNFPKVWLGDSVMEQAVRLRERITNGLDQKIVTINLGVGGNQRKRVSDEFEIGMTLALLNDDNTRVILDLGFGSEENARSEKILAASAAAGYQTEQLAFDQINKVRADSRIIAIQCSVAEIAALINCSDEFIGYDSACQHIAAAQGVKTVTVFAGSNNARFIRRWHACGPNVSEILYVDTLSRERIINSEELIARLQDLRLS